MSDKRSLGLDCHVEVEKHYYSVPHTLLRGAIWARLTARTVELFHRGKRVAVHVRSSSNRKHTTVRDHMPSSHQRYADWTPERIKRQAGEIGPKTAAAAINSSGAPTTSSISPGQCAPTRARQCSTPL